MEVVLTSNLVSSETEKVITACWGGEGLRPQCPLSVGGVFFLRQISKANNIVTVLLLIILTIIGT